DGHRTGALDEREHLEGSGQHPRADRLGRLRVEAPELSHELAEGPLEPAHGALVHRLRAGHVAGILGAAGGHRASPSGSPSGSGRRMLPVAVSAFIPSGTDTVARSASAACARSMLVIRPRGIAGRNTIAMRLTTANGTAMRNACEMPPAWMASMTPRSASGISDTFGRVPDASSRSQRGASSPRLARAVATSALRSTKSCVTRAASAAPMSETPTVPPRLRKKVTPELATPIRDRKSVV